MLNSSLSNNDKTASNEFSEFANTIAWATVILDNSHFDLAWLYKFNNSSFDLDSSLFTNNLNSFECSSHKPLAWTLEQRWFKNLSASKFWASLLSNELSVNSNLIDSVLNWALINIKK